MIAAALLFAAAPASTATDAERAFAADAQRIGQWSAFRKYADKDAVMFTPQAAWARDFLRGRKDPPRAISWRAAVSYVSCDGRTAVNSGPWFGVGGHVGGTFNTVWQKGAAGWRWVYDGGGPLTGSAARAGAPAIRRASCAGKPKGAPITPPPPLSTHKAEVAKADNGRGESADRTLGWDWQVDAHGTRRFRLFQWTGRRYVQVLTRHARAR
ncbi:hypothetical protein [Sphingomonas sp.]|uniref:hypothetical protein n=1 Tax=Sphingomonas sp. TaxID=28214 RepID=UPI0025FB803C|nr:hypothetical protein [Sphingomonas sp.]MBV9529375.1 hypothetical protein [Sphingomonas sp.]